MRLLTNGWIPAYLDYTAPQESPELFHFWVAITVLATTLGRNVWIDRGFYKIWPNHYTVLVAASALCRKSIAVGIGRGLLEKAEIIEVDSERITDAALWQWMGEQAAKTGKAELLLFSDELKNTLSPDEARQGVVTTLTRVYHCPEIVKNRTKGSGVDVVENACVNILAATTPTDFSIIIPGASTGTGFTSRLHTVYQSTSRHRKAELIKDYEMEVKLINDLQHIRKIEGEIKLLPEAWDWWKDWYENKFKLPESELLDSFYGRKHDYVLKLGMILSLSEQDTLFIRRKDVVRALAFLDQLESWMPYTLSLLGSEQYLLDADKVVLQIERAGGKITKSKLLQLNWRKIGEEELSKIVSHLQAADRIVAKLAGPTTWYEIKKKEGDK